MYELIKSIIESRTFKDSNNLDRKVKALWLSDEITDEQYAELKSMLFTNPVKDYAVQNEIDNLWAEVHRLASIVDNLPAPSDDEQDEDIPGWVQPTGAHDAYSIGDKVRFNGKVYESLINGNVWSPEAYPAGWKEV